MKEDDFNINRFNITIVGLGLVGGSYAMALGKLKPKSIWAVDIDNKALRTAEELNIIDKGYTDGKIPLNNSDLVIICLYPALVKKFIEDNINNFKAGAIITDVTGIKTGVIEEINNLLPKNVDFVFGHPMAGREKKGLEYASAEVFKGANYIITPNRRNKEKSIKIIETIAKEVGFKSVTKISPEIHDNAIAFTSQLPHVIAVALINSDNLGINTGLFIGDSYKELTRIAQINGDLWTELFIGNKENLVKHIEIFEKNIKVLKKAIINEEREILQKEFDESSRRRREIS
ncbi:prephenate dehydrogenase [Clostridium tetanomorphum]|uniref:Prephenate dehydrogenase n=1 Tax=Clostridium tetanomorphum TaxID=1553 RepID=A0A923E7Z3_CLOTT|nr:prephenate dehydrogenase [Clostridium tetanomorphum]KAJ51009.1 prephenate dehydrogenase [Clostridium tetanomorphum DSM 665]MBC2396376.1 prephenate dehydrogenase [Clostridium tetanomorphum]MBP1863395.1 prephenate dehydrogenase [Clostridium tetanomorphum]NRS83492.1 prephenate dehydrogenase [Clostridium tetanomorphum]NRZ96692.1 prephenate dehydrogenase [Clostridium tetanomorphum]